MAIEKASAGVVLTKAGYRRLLRDVEALLLEGREAAERAVGAIRAQTYHRVGQRVVAEGLSERAGYGEATLARLSEELSLDLRTLQQAVQFARVYGELPATMLTWAHYRTLLGVGVPEVRQWYEEQALEQGWSTRELARAVKGDAYAGTGASTGTRTRTGAKLPRPGVGTFVYRGEVLRVLDGDTIEMRLDLGFDVWRVQRIRLAGVDAPPVSTPEGRAARDYVLDRLAKAPRVVVRTNKHDIHMRYVGHVLYAHREMDDGEVFAKGRYLNAELLARGLAKTY